MCLKHSLFSEFFYKMLSHHDAHGFLKTIGPEFFLAQKVAPDPWFLTLGNHAWQLPLENAHWLPCFMIKTLKF